MHIAISLIQQNNALSQVCYPLATYVDCFIRVKSYDFSLIGIILSCPDHEFYEPYVPITS